MAQFPWVKKKKNRCSGATYFLWSLWILKGLGLFMACLGCHNKTPTHTSKPQHILHSAKAQGSRTKWSALAIGSSYVFSTSLHPWALWMCPAAHFLWRHRAELDSDASRNLSLHQSFFRGLVYKHSAIFRHCGPGLQHMGKWRGAHWPCKASAGVLHRRQGVPVGCSFPVCWLTALALRQSGRREPRCWNRSEWRSLWRGPMALSCGEGLMLCCFGAGGRGRRLLSNSAQILAQKGAASRHRCSWQVWWLSWGISQSVSHPWKPVAA